MKKELTLKQIVDARRAIGETFNSKVNFKLAYKIALWMDSTKPDEDFFTEKYRGILEECVDKDNNVVQALVATHDAEIAELLNQKREIECTIEMAELEDVQIAPLALVALMPIIVTV